jgi:hypothetical protein
MVRGLDMLHGYDDIARLKAEVHCGTVLERLSPPWRLDRRESTRSALKYRRDRGEIIIVNHDGHGWWDPCDADAKGDVLNLVQRLAPGAGFKEALQQLRELAGIFPALPEHCPEAGRPRQPVTERWLARPPLTSGSATWRYLAGERGLPGRILLCAAGQGLVREGPDGSAWFAHRADDGSLTGIEMRGPNWRGFSAASEKSLFRLPGLAASPSRLAVTEAPIDALSLAALEGPRADTLYLATAGGMGPGTVTALQVLLAGLAGEPSAQLVAATDADLAGDRYALFLVELAATAGVDCQRLRPPRGLKDWNDVWRAAARRLGEMRRSEGEVAGTDAGPRRFPRQPRRTGSESEKTVIPARPLPSPGRTSRVGHVEAR